MSRNPSTSSKRLRKKLTALGHFETGMSQKCMQDMLTAFENSKVLTVSPNAKAENKPSKTSPDTPDTSSTELQNPPNQTHPQTSPERRYKDVLDRRMPWTLFPNASELTLEQRTRIMAAYKLHQRTYAYKTARTSLKFAGEPPPVIIPIAKRRSVKNGKPSANSDDENVRNTLTESRLLGDKMEVASENRERDKRNFSSLIECDTVEFTMDVTSQEPCSSTKNTINTRSRLKKLKV